MQGKKYRLTRDYHKPNGEVLQSGSVIADVADSHTYVPLEGKVWVRFSEDFVVSSPDWFELLPSEDEPVASELQPAPRYSLQDLYKLVTQYYEEAGKEHFDASVGDFVDWIAVRESEEPQPSDPKGINLLDPSQDLPFTVTNREVKVTCCACNQELTPEEDRWVRHNCPEHPKEDEPSLPEKIQSLGTCKVPATMLSQQEDGFLLTAEGGGAIAQAVNDIIEYLRKKNL